MNKKKRKADIKSKLVAAVCMLLVSTIMMISSTYAWFTLSTAPEVTGITTAVGANGNLEMALLPVSGNLNDITSGVGDSTLAWVLKNLTWGNLVDLSDETYGLDQITLNPSKLNAVLDTNGNPTTLADILLKTPVYGADGRVSSLAANGITSLFESSSNNFPSKTGFGVRGVGVASGMSDRQLAYRNHASAASTAMAQARTAASQSLNLNGASLANIALAHGVDATATHTHADIASLQAIINDLLGIKYEPATGDDAKYKEITTTTEGDVTYVSYHPIAEGETGTHKVTYTGKGVLDYIENAYLSYIVALGASQASVNAGMDDTEFKAFQTAVLGAADVYAAADLCATHGVTLPPAVTVPLTELKITREAVENANDEVGAVTKTTDIAWSEISTALYRLADTDAMKINGYAASTVKDNMSAIINSVASQGLNVTMATGGGVYADVADHCGDYNAAIVIKKVEYNGLTLENMNATMKTQTGQNPTYLSALNSAVSAALAPESTGGQVMPLTELYGYVIDLAFRTNASESNLLLQVDPADRIYDNNGNEETMGGGSSMTFTSTTSDFTVEQMKNLMECIRIVFFDPAGKGVYATAKLDVANAEIGAGGNSVTAKLYLYTIESVTTYTEATYTAGGTFYVKNVVTSYTQYTGTEAPTDGTQLYTLEGDTYTAADYTEGGTFYVVESTEDVYTQYTGDGTNAGQLYTATTSKVETKLTDNVITGLTQNEAKAVSCLVYLDGESITNKDVAANAATSMTGTMNLQFASSAELVPMENGNLHLDGTTAPATSSSQEESNP